DQERVVLLKDRVQPLGALRKSRGFDVAVIDRKVEVAEIDLGDRGAHRAQLAHRDREQLLVERAFARAAREGEDLGRHVYSAAARGRSQMIGNTASSAG